MGLQPQHRILNVEDDAAVALLERKRLETEGFRVVDAADGATALRMLGEETFDAVLLDYRLPDMTGREVVRRLPPSSRMTPVIVITAYGDERLAVELMKAGVVDYVAKDVSQDFIRTLPAKIRASLRR
jgi:two-component system, sensor histidine kinase